MNTAQPFYICPQCFNASESNAQCHERPMVHYKGYPAGHPQLKPVMSKTGQVQSAMPRWMLAKS